MGRKDTEYTGSPKHDALCMWIANNARPLWGDLPLDRYVRKLQLLPHDGVETRRWEYNPYDLLSRMLPEPPRDADGCRLPPYKCNGPDREISNMWWEAEKEAREAARAGALFLVRERVQQSIDGGLLLPVGVEWEYPLVLDKRTLPVGYVDVRVTVEAPKAVHLGPGERPCTDGILSSYIVRDVWVEAKPRIDSVGALLRQLKKYQAIADSFGTWPPPRIEVVSPDCRFAGLIREQGFSFHEAPSSALVLEAAE